MIKIYTQEFVNISGHIIKKLPAQICENYLYIQPAQLRAMLNKNKFDKVDAKLRIWRDLGWLICEPGRFNKIITVDKRCKRMCVLNLTAYMRMKELLAMEKREAVAANAKSGAGETVRAHQLDCGPD